MPQALILIGLTTIKLPLVGLIFSIIYFLARIVYSISYVRGGPNLRALGSIPMNFLVVMPSIGFAIYTVVEYLRQYNVTASATIIADGVIA